MYRTHTVSVGISVDPAVVYAFASKPENMPVWAPGFVQSIERRGGRWIAQTSLGEAAVRFAPPNDFGVIDHDVEIGSTTFHNAVRVIPNGSGSEVLFTAIQFPGVADEQFKTDLEVVRSDLNKLRTVLEHQSST
jgi:hypothetical protein